MSQPLTGGLPPFLRLPAGAIIRLNALDPTTGAEVAGVRVTDTSLFVRVVAGSVNADNTPLPFLVPSGEMV